MSEIQTRVLTLYAVKSIKDKAEAYLKEAKDKLIPVKIDPDKAQSMTIEEGDLQVKFSPTKGKKTFDVLKARAFLKDRLGEQFDSYFSSYKIEATNKQPPKELVDQMREYFTIKKVEDITEERVTRLPLGLTPDEIEEHCYKRGASYFKMTTPSKISDGEIVERLKRLDVNVVAGLLADGNQENQ